ncbi:MAG: DUF4920 domain-containing protein [Nannocystis sp.]|nr:DUF4920 domain-containing protein [Nannocystis sp.]MBA3545467.1 DUF4920 domain-containing protein [Nannocystis sp.]
MRSNFLLSLSLVGLLAAGCNNAPAPAAQASAEVKAAELKPAEVKVAAVEPAKAADAEEEGCIYKDAKADKHDEADCPHGGGEHGDAAGTATPGHYGAAFALKEAKPLGQVLASAKDGLKDPVQVSGEVESVCQKKGCWLVVKDGEAQARILMKDHAFTVPMDTKGKPVVVEGTLEARTFNEAQVKHLEKDAGKDPAAVAGERTEYVLTATGIELKNS